MSRTEASRPTDKGPLIPGRHPAHRHDRQLGGLGVVLAFELCGETWSASSLGFPFRIVVHMSPFLKSKTIPPGVVAGLRKVQNLSGWIIGCEAKRANKNGFLLRLAYGLGSKVDAKPERIRHLNCLFGIKLQARRRARRRPPRIEER